MSIKPNRRLHPDHMTIGQLRAALANVSPEYDDCPVDTEGCDCCGPCGGIEICIENGLASFVMVRDDRCGIGGLIAPQPRGVA